MENSLYFYFLAFLIAYFFGSFPSAYLLVKWFHKKDVRREGSGNVGMLNALRSSGSKPLAAAVLLLDMFKGWLPAFLMTRFFPEDFLLTTAVVTGVLVGHILPVWLKFHGGRGLAVTAGALLVINTTVVALWLILWLVFYVLLRQHIVANLIATFLMPVIVFFGKETLFDTQILLVILPVCFIIFLKHLERIPNVVENRK